MPWDRSRNEKGKGTKDTISALFRSHPSTQATLDHTLASTASTSLRAVCLSVVPQFLQQGIKSIVTSQHVNNLAISSTELNGREKTMLNYVPLLPLLLSLNINIFIHYLLFPGGSMVKTHLPM